MSWVVSHATGNRNVRHTLRALESSGMLGVFRTTVAFGSGAARGLRLPSYLLRQIERRSYDLPGEKIQTRRFAELRRQVLAAVPISLLRRTSEPSGRFGFARVAEDFDNWAARRIAPSSAGTYLYLDQAEKQLERAAALGVPAVLECHHALASFTAQIIREEALRHPDWVSTTVDADARTEAQQTRQLRQLELATTIVVPSRQVSDSIRGSVAPRADVVHLPYGCPQPLPARSPAVRNASGPLRLLYVGRLTAVKGLAYLDEAMRALPQGSVELRIAGPRPADVNRALDSLLRRNTYVGRLTRAEVIAEMRRADAFIMPSLVEGRSLAVLEALSTGAPCIVTPGSGVDDLIERGAGFVVPNADAAAIASALDTILRQPTMLHDMSSMATRIATESSWAAFESQTVQLAAALANQRDNQR